MLGKCWVNVGKTIKTNAGLMLGKWWLNVRKTIKKNVGFMLVNVGLMLVKQQKMLG